MSDSGGKAVSPPHTIYAKQLYSLCYGCPLWFPEPQEGYYEVLIGDVGYFNETGRFLRLFNALSPADDPINHRFGVPEDFNHLTIDPVFVDSGPNAIRERQVLSSKSVKSTEFQVSGEAQAPVASASLGFKFSCSQENGAALIISEPAYRRLVIRSKHIQNYVKQHHKSWCEFADRIGFIVSKDDIIFIRGWHKTGPWAAMAWTAKNDEYGVSVQAGANVAQAGFEFKISESCTGSVIKRWGPDKGDDLGPHIYRMPSVPLKPRTEEIHSHPHDHDQTIFVNYYKVKYRPWLGTKLEARAGPHTISRSPSPDFDGQSLVADSQSSASLHDLIDAILDYILDTESDVQMAIASEGTLKSLFEGSEWPADVATWLRVNHPRIDVDEDNTGSLSLIDEVHRGFRRREAERRARREAQPQPPGDDDTDMGSDKGKGTGERNPHAGTILLKRNLDKQEFLEWPHRVLADLAEGGGGSPTPGALSDDGRFLAFGSEDAKIRLWDLSKDSLHKIQVHSDQVLATAFFPDSSRLVSGSTDTTAVVFNLQTFAKEQELAGHEADVWSVAVSPDGKTIATGSVDCSMKLWHTTPIVNNPVAYATQEDHTAVVMIVAFTPDSSKVISCSDSEGYVWNTHDGSPIATLEGHTGVIWGLAITSDGNRLATGSEDHTARIWSTTTGDMLVLIAEHTAPIWGVAFSPDNRQILCGSYDCTISMTNSWTGERKYIRKERPSVIHTVAYSPDALTVACGCADGSVKFWKAEDGEFIAELQAHRDKIKSVKFTPDSRNLVSLSEDGTARVWDVPDVLCVS